VKDHGLAEVMVVAMDVEAVAELLQTLAELSPNKKNFSKHFNNITGAIITPHDRKRHQEEGLCFN
jgi:hypothetical protein